MIFTDKEEKIARLALDKGAKNGERQAAAIKLIESLYARGIEVENLEGPDAPPQTIYRDVPVYRDVYVAPKPKKFLTDVKDFATMMALMTLSMIVVFACAYVLAIILLTTKPTLTQTNIPQPTPTLISANDWWKVNKQ